jgi:hypothetical protein
MPSGPPILDSIGPSTGSPPSRFLPANAASAVAIELNTGANLTSSPVTADSVPGLRLVSHLADSVTS